MNVREIQIEDYLYKLPQNRIAQYPLEQRDGSKLLIANRGTCRQDQFKNLHQYLPHDSLMFFNDTRVFHARLALSKSSGAKIEIFLLQAISPTPFIEEAFAVKNSCVWECLVGNKKKWKQGALVSHIKINQQEVSISASYVKAVGNAHHIRFQWESEHSFGEIVEQWGKIPLPPYMKRESDANDQKRYQTIYARQEGSVAAPTAGLHFTAAVLEQLEKIKITRDFLTLDVGAGTFKPVSSEKMSGHEMHREKVYIRLQSIEDLIKSLSKRKIIAVGTTTTRTLESLFWFGQKLSTNPMASFHINQWDPYEEYDNLLSPKEALAQVLDYMKRSKLDLLQGETQLIIAPGYEFKFLDILITNFHQPKSTLLLLVAAFYGEQWKDVYQYALDNEFRFLSYGDSCLFYRK